MIASPITLKIIINERMLKNDNVRGREGRGIKLKNDRGRGCPSIIGEWIKRTQNATQVQRTVSARIKSVITKRGGKTHSIRTKGTILGGG